MPPQLENQFFKLERCFKPINAREAGLARAFGMDDRWFRLGDHGRYPAQVSGNFEPQAVRLLSSGRLDNAINPPSSIWKKLDGATTHNQNPSWWNYDHCLC